MQDEEKSTKYEDIILPNLLQIEAWYRDGATDKEVYEALGIGKTTFYKYVKEHLELKELQKRTKPIVDIEVENMLLKKSLGYKVNISKPFKVKHIEYNDNGKKISEDEEIVYVDEEVYIPPSDTDMIFWLKNRKPYVWRDKHEIEHSGAIRLEDVL